MKTCAFTIADQKNMKWATMLEKSFKHFHPDIPLIIYGDKEIAETNISKPLIFYLATPYFAKELIKEYDQVVKIDADSIITAPLEILDNPEKFDVGVVFNWTRDDYSNSVKVWDVTPQGYFNNGFVVFRSEEVIRHIWRLCNEKFFTNYQMREQDMLNIVCYYGNYIVKVIDEGNSWYGLRSKSEWNKAIMKDGKIVILKGKDMFPEKDKTIRCIHFAGGDTGVKMNYKIYFQEPVIEYLDSILK